MKHISQYLILFLALTYFSCQPTEKKKAISLIQKSIEAHGGQKAWSEIQTLSLKKETWLYNESGQIENHLVQHQTYRLKPYFEASMDWEKDSIKHRIVFDGLKTQYWMQGNEVKNENFLQSKKKDLDAGFYVLNKPFSLLDEHLHVKHEGLSNLADGQKVESVQIIDGNPEDPNADIWWYYFDPESYILIAYKVKTADHYSMVYNLAIDKSTGLVLPSKRESFRVDSLGNHLYLRARYEYVGYGVKD